MRVAHPFVPFGTRSNRADPFAAGGGNEANPHPRVKFSSVLFVEPFHPATHTGSGAYERGMREADPAKRRSSARLDAMETNALRMECSAEILRGRWRPSRLAIVGRQSDELAQKNKCHGCTRAVDGRIANAPSRNSMRSCERLTPTPKRGPGTAVPGPLWFSGRQVLDSAPRSWSIRAIDGQLFQFQLGDCHIDTITFNASEDTQAILRVGAGVGNVVSALCLE